MARLRRRTTARPPAPEPLTPEQIARTITFLNSDAASGVSGVNLLIDNGYILSSLSGSYEPGQMLAQLLLAKG